MTRAAFEFPEVLFRRFPGEDLDLKQHGRVVFRCHEDLADILVDELLCDDSLCRVALSICQDSADLIDLLLEGVALCGCLLQLCDLLFGFFNFNLVAIFGGARSVFAVIVYTLIALSAIWLIISPCITDGKLDMNDKN